MAPIPSPARESLRGEYGRLWAEAILVGPPPIEAEGENDIPGNDEQARDELQDSTP